MYKHIFEGERSGDTPKGLHAYQNGSKLSNIAKVIKTIGNDNKVHKLKWQLTTASKPVEKESTMFPKWMPESHVKALIVINKPNLIEEKIERTEELKQHILHGLEIELAVKGNTAYPITK